MTPFRYEHAANRADAIIRVGQSGAQFIAGGTSQVDLMKEGVQQLTVLVDIARIGLDVITRLDGGGLGIGSNVKNAAAADHPTLRQRYPAITEAIQAGASQQIRNRASMAGNPLQRTRCPYLRDPAQPCNKRDPGSGCAAVIGFNRTQAIFGQTDRGPRDPATCIAVHPSDLAVALSAHDAVLVIESPSGERRIGFDELLRLPGDDPSRDTNLAYDDLITAIELPAFSGRSHYLKVRDRASYAYALVSCAVVLDMADDGHGDRIVAGRVALGSVAAKPWRVQEAEALLAGERPSAALFAEVAERMVAGARTYSMNGYKVPLSHALILRGLMETSGLEPLAGPSGTAFAASVGGMGGTAALEHVA